MTPDETPTSDSSEDAASDPGVQLRLFPLRTVLFPGMPLPLHIFEDRYKLMIGECVRDEVPFGVVLIRQGAEAGGPARVYPIGTVARIQQVEKLADGRMNILALGEHRFRITELVQEEPYMSARVSFLPQPISEMPEDDLIDLSGAVARAFVTYDRLTALVDSDWQTQEDLPHGAADIAYLVASAMSLSPREKQALLAQDSVDTLLKAERNALEQRSYHHRSILAVRPILEKIREEHGKPPKPFRLN
ncbi:MAG: LON peptidase substrate-binding domain-containing protein [Candidatus Poribacteria bacterium]